jgi:hypothetical protein
LIHRLLEHSASGTFAIENRSYYQPTGKLIVSQTRSVVSPVQVRHTLMENYPERFPDSNTARVPAALLGGFFACYLTHPFDTIKTCMQGDIERTTYGTFTQTASKIWAQSSLPGFYRGATFRYGRMVCAVFIMDLMKETIAHALYPAAFA